MTILCPTPASVTWLHHAALCHAALCCATNCATDDDTVPHISFPDLAAPCTRQHLHATTCWTSQDERSCMATGHKIQDRSFDGPGPNACQDRLRIWAGFCRHFQGLHATHTANLSHCKSDRQGWCLPHSSDLILTSYHFQYQPCVSWRGHCRPASRHQGLCSYERPAPPSMYTYC